MGEREILWCPIINRDRLVYAYIIRADAHVERGGINERLERRARLAPRLSGAIELVFGIVAATIERHDLTAPVHQHSRCLARFDFFSLGVHARFQRFGDFGLQFGINGQADDHVVRQLWQQLIGALGGGVEDETELRVLFRLRRDFDIRGEGNLRAFRSDEPGL